MLTDPNDGKEKLAYYMCRDCHKFHYGTENIYVSHYQHREAEPRLTDRFRVNG